MEKLEIDIDIKDLFWEFLRKWRLIVICMLVGGLLLGISAYISDYKAAKTPATPIIQQSTREILESISEDEWATVIAADELNTQIVEKSQYLANSILMEINPFSENRVILEYTVSGDMASAAMLSYESWSFMDAGKAEQNSEEKPEYMNELITVECNEEAGLMMVQILQKDAESCTKLSEEVKNALQEYSVYLNVTGIIHDFRLITETQSVVVDDGLHQFQDEYTNEVLSDIENLSKKKAEMNGNQIAAYLMMIKGELEGFFEASASENEEQDNVSAEIAVIETPVKVSVDGKQILIGMVLGAILAVAYIFVAYLMTGRLRKAEEIEKLYHISLLGVVEESVNKKRMFAAVDTFIRKLEHCKEQKLSIDEKIELAAASIAIQCRKYNFDTVYVSGSKVSEVSAEVLEKLKAALARQEIGAVIGKDIAGNADALLQAAEMGNTVLFELERKSAYKDILNNVQTCTTNHIRMLGMVVAEQ